MPRMAEEFKLKVSENNVKYLLRIFGFCNKMNTWRTGRVVHSLPFLVGGSEFQLDIYPNGIDRQTQGHVSVYLNNRSDSLVQVKFEAEVGSEKFSDTFDISPKSNFGWPTFYDHDSLRGDDEALTDGNLSVRANVSLIWEEVTTERKEVKESKAEVTDLKSEVANLKKETLASKKEVNDLKKKIETMDRNLAAQFKALEISSKKTSLPCPECPICFDEMKPPTRIVQCRSGHLVCQQCMNRPQVSSFTQYFVW